MQPVTPSYISKLERAKKHLVDLETEIDRFSNRHPYTVRTSIEGKKKREVHRLHFTASPANTDIPLLLADTIHNLRSGLDHLMGALVAPKFRNDCYFPIYFQGVWEPSTPGENAERAKSRKRWADDTASVTPDALAILKGLQPPDNYPIDPRGDQDYFRLINKLSNDDKHRKLPVYASGLRNFIVEFDRADGVHEVTGIQDLGTRDALDNEAEIKGLPKGAVNVQVSGTVSVAIRHTTEPQLRIPLPSVLAGATAMVERAIVDLSPHVRS